MKYHDHNPVDSREKNCGPQIKRVPKILLPQSCRFPSLVGNVSPLSPLQVATGATANLPPGTQALEQRTAAEEAECISTAASPVAYLGPADITSGMLGLVTLGL